MAMHDACLNAQHCDGQSQMQVNFKCLNYLVTVTFELDDTEINQSTAYTLTVKPTGTTTTYSQVAMRVTFPEELGMSVDDSMTCETSATSGYNSGGPSCTHGIDDTSGNQDVYVQISNLKPRWFQYQVLIQGIVNPPSAIFTRNIIVATCKTDDCDPDDYIEELDRNSLQWSSATLDIDNVEIRSDKMLNGAEEVTLNYTVIIQNKITPKGIVYLVLPKQNYWFIDEGAPRKDCLLYDCEERDLELKILTATSSSSSFDTEVPFAEVYYNVDGLDDKNDIMEILLDNEEDIAAGLNVRFSIYPCKNPPTLQDLVTFAGWTADKDENKIEEWSGAEYHTTLPNKFSENSFVEILDTDPDWDDYMVSMTLRTYSFHVELLYNDIPLHSVIVITWPSNWILNCDTDQYVANCIENCEAFTLVCDPPSNSLLLYAGFETIYVQYGTGYVEFTIEGVDNPPITEEKFLTVTTKDANEVLIDSMFEVFNLEFVTGLITVESIYPSDSLIFSNNGTYTFKFNAQHEILTTYELVITMPASIEVQQNSACTLYGAENSEYSCAADAAANSITIRDFLLESVEPLTWMTVEVDSMRNPIDYIDPGETIFKFTDGSGGEIDDGSFDSWDDGDDLYSASYIPTFFVTPQDKTAGASPVTYDFVVRPFSKVAKGAIIVVDIPPELEIANSQRLARACPKADIDGFSFDSINCQYSKGKSSVTITKGYKNLDSAENPPLIKFPISEFTNPRSKAPISMFNVTIYNENMLPLFYYNNSVGPTVLMDSVDEPGDFGFERSISRNGENSNYTWTIKIGAMYVSGDIITIDLPKGVRFTDASRCYGTSFWLGNAEIPCDLSQDRQTVNFTVAIGNRRRLQDDIDYHRGRLLFTSIAANSIINFMVTEITSPDSLKPLSGQIKYQITDVNGYLIESLSQGIVIQNTELGQFNTTFSGITPDYFDSNVLANYTFSFQPNNYEQNMKIMLILPNQIYFPDEGNITCRGIKGTDKAELNCTMVRINETVKNDYIFISDAVVEKDVAPDEIRIQINSLQNPKSNIVTDSFQIKTINDEGYDIDEQTTGLEVNFFCMFPCKSCNESTPTLCDSCYTATTDFIYLLDQKCLEVCPAGMFETNLTTPTPTCDFCDFPCMTCGINATDCITCAPGYLLYTVDNTCYEEIIWYFPFLGGAGVFFVFVLFVDCICKSTDFTDSILYLLALLETGVMGYLSFLWFMGEIDGDRSLSLISFGVQVTLNILFIPVHIKLMLKNGSPEYKQVFKNYKCTAWCCSCMAYLLNFKMAVIMVSSFAGRPRFSGSFSNDSWQKFNIFSILYICLVYLPFIADFYIYFSTFGLRKLTSYIAGELVVIMTIICLILLLEILAQCACSGINESDLGKRAGLLGGKKGGKGIKKQRRAMRSGMGNDESDYGDEYDSQEDYGSELEALKAKRAAAKKLEDSEEEESDEYYDEEEEAESEMFSESIDDLKKTKKKGKKNPQLDMLEDLAKQMKEEKEALKAEQEQILQDKLKLLEEKERYLNEFGNIDEKLDHQRTEVNQELEKMQDTIEQEMERRLNEKAQDDLMNRMGKGPTIKIPEPVTKEVELSKSIDGDEEYWIQNLSGIQDGVSEHAPGGQGVREKDASLIEYMEPVSARASNIGSMREAEEDIEQRANASQGPVFGNDLDGTVSRHGTEQNYLSRSNAAFGQPSDNQNREKEGTQEDYVDGASAVFSNPSHITGPLGKSQHATEQHFVNKSEADFDNTSALVHNKEIANPERRQSADFGNVSQHLPMDKSIHGQLTPRPEMDKNGHSDESSEGIVADHRPFNGIQDAMANQDQLRKSHAPDPDQTISESEEVKEDGPPSARRRIKQVLYSDKSESSVDDMMEDTPSNYNIANGRLEGKSMGLKAILLYAKNQGVQLGTGLPQIAEENALNRQSVQQSSGEGGAQWNHMSQPMQGRTRTQIAGANEINRTIDDDNRGGKRGSKRNPGSKQFKEPAEMGNNSARSNNQKDLAQIQKNNFV